MNKSFLCCHQFMMIVTQDTHPLPSPIFRTPLLAKLHSRVPAPVFPHHLQARPSLHACRKILHCQHPLMLIASPRRLIPRIAVMVHFRDLRPTRHFPYHHQQLHFQYHPHQLHSRYHRAPLCFPPARLNFRFLRHLWQCVPLPLPTRRTVWMTIPHNLSSYARPQIVRETSKAGGQLQRRHQ